jgi:hypothetical protein
MDHRHRRRLFLPLAGAVIGVLAALVIAWVINNFVSGHWEGGAYVGAAFVGLVAGPVLGALIAAVHDDGEDESTSYDGPVGRADAPIAGAESEDLHRRPARRPALRR